MKSERESVAKQKAYINDLEECKALQPSGALWYEDYVIGEMKAATWQPMLLCPKKWRFFIWVDSEDG